MLGEKERVGTKRDPEFISVSCSDCQQTPCVLGFFLALFTLFLPLLQAVITLSPESCVFTSWTRGIRKILSLSSELFALPLRNQ